jgi:hypothetical protein
MTFSLIEWFGRISRKIFRESIIFFLPFFPHVKGFKTTKNFLFTLFIIPVYQKCFVLHSSLVVHKKLTEHFYVSQKKFSRIELVWKIPRKKFFAKKGKIRENIFRKNFFSRKFFLLTLFRPWVYMHTPFLFIRYFYSSERAGITFYDLYFLFIRHLSVQFCRKIIIGFQVKTFLSKALLIELLYELFTCKEIKQYL